MVEARTKERRHCIEMRGHRDNAPTARCPDIRTAGRHFLKGHIPTAREEAARDEIHDGALVIAGRGDGNELGGESYDVSHTGKLLSRVTPRQ